MIGFYFIVSDDGPSVAENLRVFGCMREPCVDDQKYLC